MYEYTTIIGLDVHSATITAALLPAGQERVVKTVTIEHHPTAVAKLQQQWARYGPCTWVYEAGQQGYTLQRQLEAAGDVCDVIAPGLIPVRPGDRVKTDRRDAEKLARLHRAGELTVVRVPSAAEEAARDLVRLREATVVDRLQVRNRLAKFLVRHGRVYTATKAWGVAHRQWLNAQQFAWPAHQLACAAAVRAWDEADARLAVLTQHVEDLASTPAYQTAVQYLRCLKGVDTLTAMTCIVETQEIHRFAHAPQFMAYTGLVSRERSSGATIRRGGITKVGNAHLRRVLVEAAWQYQRSRALSPTVAARRRDCPPAVVALAKRAEDRLHRKYRRLVARHKTPQVAATAVARELAGFIWALLRLVPAAV